MVISRHNILIQGRKKGKQTVALSVPLLRREKTFPKTHATTVFCLTGLYYVTWPPLASKDVGKLDVSLFSD